MNEKYACSYCNRSFNSKKGKSVHETKSHENGSKPWQDEEKLTELYVHEELSQSEIADRLGTSQAIIANLMSEFNIETRGPGGAEAVEELRDAEWVREKYCDRGMSIHDIAEFLDCNPQTVLNWINQHDIPLSERHRPVIDERLKDKSMMRRLYRNQRLSSSEIAEKFECSESSVLKWLHNHGIEVRGHTGNRDFPEIHDPWKLWDLYWGRGLSTNRIAKKFGCDTSTVTHQMISLGIPRRSMSEAMPVGEKHHNWSENSSGPYYGSEWPHQRKKAIERDNHECKFCGLTEQEHIAIHGRSLDVHHVTPLGEFEETRVANRLSNLITLCFNCHRSIEESLYTERNIRPETTTGQIELAADD